MRASLRRCALMAVSGAGCADNLETCLQNHKKYVILGIEKDNRPQWWVALGYDLENHSLLGKVQEWSSYVWAIY